MTEPMGRRPGRTAGVVRGSPLRSDHLTTLGVDPTHQTKVIPTRKTPLTLAIVPLAEGRLPEASVGWSGERRLPARFRRPDRREVPGKSARRHYDRLSRRDLKGGGLVPNRAPG